MAKPVKKQKRKKYMLVEVAWDLKDIRGAAANQGISVARFAQNQVKTGVERFKTKQLRLLSD